MPVPGPPLPDAPRHNRRTGADAPTPSPDLPSVRTIGRYSGAELIGSGGMGVVYKALAPDGRPVAVKVIPHGATDESSAARLEREWRTLGTLDHPNIARVFDSGVTADGRPYFALEYIPGVPLGEYADAHRLTVRERLELFLGVSAAVTHLHQRGVIHRDLKPGNILVTDFDGRPTPKLIDFGLAKLIGTPSGATAAGGYVGTPNYMAPEQAAGTAVAVDARADVYALGVILFELLTGTVPLTTGDDPEEGFLERLIRLQVSDAPPPSSRLDGPAAAEVADLRNTDPPALRSVVAGDLDRVVLKALARNREKRYATAEELAADVRRYLATEPEPVSVASPGPFGQLVRFFRRNRAVALGLAAGCHGLLAVGSVAVCGLVRARCANRPVPDVGEIVPPPRLAVRAAGS